MFIISVLIASCYYQHVIASLTVCLYINRQLTTALNSLDPLLGLSQFV